MFGDGIGSLFVTIGAETKGLESGLHRAESGLSGLAGKAMSFGAGLGGWITVGVAAIQGLGGVFQSVTDGVMGTNAALQQSGVAWEVLLGGADQAQAKLTELYGFAASTPFEFGEVDKASRVLQTFGGDLLNTSTNLTMIGDVAAGVGQPFGDVAMWAARMYDAFKSGQPFGEAAARLQEMGAMSGETRLKLEEMQKAGASADEMWAVLSGSMGRFGGMMQKQAETFGGRLSTMKDSIDQLLATAGKPIFDVMSSSLGKLNALLSSPAAASFVQSVAVGIAGALEWVGSAIGAAIPKIQALGTIIGAVFQGFKTGNFNGIFGPILEQLDKLAGGLTLTGPVNTALNLFQVLRDGAITFFQALSGDWGGQFDTRINGAVKTAGVLGLAIRDIAQWVTGTAIPALMQFGAMVISAFQQAQPHVQAFVSQVLPQIGQGIQTALPYVQQFGSFLVTAFHTAAPMVQQFATGVLPALQAGFAQISTAVQAIVPYIAQFGTTLVNLIQPTLPVIQQIATVIGAGLGGAFAVIMPLVQQIGSTFMAQLPAIKGLWDQLLSAVQPLAPVLAVLAGIVGGVLAAAVGIAMGTLGGLAGLLNGVIPGAVQIAQGSITVISGVIQTLSAVVTGVVQIVGSAIHGDWEGAWNAAKSMVSQAASGISTIISGLSQMVTGLISGMVGGVVGYVSGFVSTVIGFFQNLYMVLVGGSIVPDMVRAIQNAFTGMVSAVVSTVSGWVTAIVGFFTNLFTEATTKVQTLQTNVTTTFDTLKTNASNTISGLVTTVVTFFGNLATDAWNRVQTLKTNILSEFGNLVSMVKLAMSQFKDTVINTILDLVGSAASAAQEVGSSIASGIADGITAGLGWIVDAARSAAQAAIDAAMSILKARSPSRVFWDIGKWTMQGFANGINDNAMLAVGSIERVMQDVIAVRRMNDSLGGRAHIDTAVEAIGATAGVSGRGATHVEIHQHIAGSVITERELDERIAEGVNNMRYVRRIA